MGLEHAGNMAAILDLLRAQDNGAEGEGDPGYRVEELAEAMGVSISAMHGKINALYRQGRLVSGRRAYRARDGRLMRVPVYRVAEPAEA